MSNLTVLYVVWLVSVAVMWGITCWLFHKRKKFRNGFFFLQMLLISVTGSEMFEMNGRSVFALIEFLILFGELKYSQKKWGYPNVGILVKLVSVIGIGWIMANLIP